MPKLPGAIYAAYVSAAKACIQEMHEGGARASELFKAPGSGTRPPPSGDGSGGGGGSGTAVSGDRQIRKPDGADQAPPLVGAGVANPERGHDGRKRKSGADGDSSSVSTKRSDHRSMSPSREDEDSTGLDELGRNVSEEAAADSGWSEKMFIETLPLDQFEEIMKGHRRPQNLPNVRMPDVNVDPGFPGCSLKKEKLTGEDIAPVIRRIWRVSAAKTADLAFLLDTARNLCERLMPEEAGEKLSEEQELAKTLLEGLQDQAWLEAASRSEVAALRAAWFTTVATKGHSVKRTLTQLRRASSVTASILDDDTARASLGRAAERAEVINDVAQARVFGFSSQGRGSKFFRAREASRPPGRSDAGPRSRQQHRENWRDMQEHASHSPSRGSSRGRGSPGRGTPRGRGGFRARRGRINA